MGQLSRTLSLREGLLESGLAEGEVVLVTDDNPVAHAGAAGIPARFHPPSEVSIADLAGSVHASVVVIDDRRAYSPEELQGIRTHARIVAIDNADLGKAADLTIIPYCHFEPGPGEEAFLSGPEYTLIGRAARAMPSRNSPVGRPKTLTIATGGTDPDRVTEKLIGWARSSRLPIGFRFLLGHGMTTDRASALTAQASANVAFAPFSLERLAEAELAICVFGVTAYEAIHLGIPLLTMAHHPRNEDAAARLEEVFPGVRDVGLASTLTAKRLDAEISGYLSSRLGKTLDFPRFDAGPTACARAILKLV